jgi:hydrogenase nickel insertion protein HypA
MHEYAVACEIAALVKQTTAGARVEKITLGVGALSGIFTESLTMYLELVLPDMGMESVKIETRDVPAVFACDCGERYEARSILTACPKCGAYARTVAAGQDCVVESIEVEDDPEHTA